MSETRLRQLCRDLNVPQIPDRVHRRMQLGIEELTRDEEEACTAAIQRATALLRPYKRRGEGPGAGGEGRELDDVSDE